MDDAKQRRQDQEDLLEQLEQAALDDPNEQQQLEHEQDRLVHGVRLQQGLGSLFGRLRDGAEQAPSLQEHFAAVIQELQVMAQLDGSLEPLRDQALDLDAGVEGLLRSLDHYGASLDSDPEHLDRIQERLAARDWNVVTEDSEQAFIHHQIPVPQDEDDETFDPDLLMSLRNKPHRQM